MFYFAKLLRAILNKSWQQHPTRHQLYGHLPPITKTIQAGRTRHAGHCCRSKDELIRDVLLWTPAYGQAKQADQLEHTFSSYVRIRDVALKTCQGRWMIGKSGERGSGISVLAARHDDDDIEGIFISRLNEFSIVLPVDPSELCFGYHLFLYYRDATFFLNLIFVIGINNSRISERIFFDW